MTPADILLDELPAAQAAPAGPDLASTARSILMSASTAADLIVLELHVPGAPQLSTVVRRLAGASRQIVVWPTTLPADRWHDGLALVAGAIEADRDRRSAVTHVVVVIGELVAAHRRIMQAESLAQRAIELAGIDPLTQLGNRRTWRRALDEEARRAARYKTPTTVVVVDLDGLKRLNDERGHAAGDAYLKRGAAAVRAASRGVDVICRLGGDEFGLLAPETDGEGAGRLAIRLRAALAGADVEASLGLATSCQGELDQAWHLADADMYADKRQRAIIRLPTSVPGCGPATSATP